MGPGEADWPWPTRASGLEEYQFGMGPRTFGAENLTGNSVEIMVAVKKDKVNGDALGTGRRKSAVARVRVRAGSGRILVNKKPHDEYFCIEQDRRQLTDVLEMVDQREKVDILIRVTGGGTTGQAGACKMGIARALVSYDSETFQSLRDGGALTRDSRMKERKKYGLHGARKGTQFSKR